MGVEFAVFENCYERSRRRNSACGNPRIKHNQYELCRGEVIHVYNQYPV